MISVIGSLNMDLVTTVVIPPKVGETVLGLNFKQSPGGKGANQADVIAKLGGKVKMIGKVGTDIFGDKLLDSLNGDGVDISQVTKTCDNSTGIAAITVNISGNNSIIVVPGANFNLLESDIDNAATTLKQSQIVIAQLEVPIKTIKYSFKKAKENEAFTILNPAPAVILDSEVLTLVDLIVPNETEIEVLSGRKLHTEQDMIDAARFLINKGIKEVIITLGSNGCLYVNKEISKKYPAHKVNAVDTTAAGDSFIGGLAVALSEGNSMDASIKFATKVSALTVTKAGAQSSLPTRQEVENIR